MALKEIKDVWGIIMMAGKGIRMKSNLPKMLHDVCGQPMARWVLDSCDAAGLKKRVLVVGHQAETMMKEFPGEKFVLQEPQKGTGHAVMVGLDKIPKSAKYVMVLSGDVPCLRPVTIRELIDYHKKVDVSATVLSFEPADTTGYGRIIRSEDGSVTGIIEHRDLSDDLLDLTECNSGIYVFNRTELGKALSLLKPSKRSGEYHLPDVIDHMIVAGDGVEAATVMNWMETLGVNSRRDQSEASDYLRWRVIEKHMSNGVTIIDPESVWIGPDVKISRDATIHPGTILSGKTQIGRDSKIGPYTELQDVTVGKECDIRHSVLEECRIDDDVKIGPYAHIRPHSRIRKGARIGNFVELKKTDFGPGSKSGHLTYLGDTKVGKDVNIGAGTITCNYDGKKKFPTVIGNRVFIGSDTILVAPIKIGNDSYTAAGSTLDQDVPPKSLAFGRARQQVKKGWLKNKKKKSGKK